MPLFFAAVESPAMNEWGSFDRADARVASGFAVRSGPGATLRTAG